MGRRHSSTSSPLAALAVILLLICSFLRCGEAARPLPVHHGNGVTDAADGPVLQEGAAAAGNGDELSISEVVTGEEAEEEVDEEATTTACEERDDECVLRRMLRDAHLDYIYTQHRGKP